VDKNTCETGSFIGKARILIAPLDWGLGHATRCIPIICELINQGHTVIIAAEGPQKILLEEEFPGIEYLPLKGYYIKYSKTKSTFILNILWQIPKTLKAINFEKRWLRKIISSKAIDIVISDNRFGLHNNNIHSVLITHQLLIKSHFLQSFLQKINYYFINKFDECWVPDFKEEPCLAGILSHPKKMPSTSVRYIGWLSRFQKREQKQETILLVLLSGPEPQRTILENKILEQLRSIKKPALLVRGLPASKAPMHINDNIKSVNHLPARELEKAIHSASFVIARSGYSTIMDLIKLKKKSILIPTPGQTEQEYLAQYLLEKKMIYSVSQESFHLHSALEAAYNFPYSFFDRDGTDLGEIISFKIPS
jgi:predicted glycosyltransferase